jgi:adenine-specific DNA-methyltransferase
MPKEYELIYRGKERKEELFVNTATSSFQEVKTFGSAQLFINEGNWTNMLIYGDNLPALKALMGNPDINGKVRLVYIDPPFSTNQDFRGGNSRTISRSTEDEIAYEDRLVGAKYLEFLRKRFILLRELLANDGSIYVHIDWKIGHYVKILMDEVWGQERFINNITRVKCNPKSFKRKAYGNMTDMILFYSKTEDYVWNDSREEMGEDDILRLFPKVDKNGRRYTTLPLHAAGETQNGPTGQPWRRRRPPKGSHWQYPPEVLDRLDEQGLIEWSSTGNPRRKHYADDILRNGKKRQDIWEFKDPPYPIYPTEKNAEMLKAIVKTSSNPNDIVLDSFSGAGTTLVCAEELRRRWIGIDNSPWAIEATLKRLSSLKEVCAFTLYNASGKPLPQTLQKFLQ